MSRRKRITIVVVVVIILALLFLWKCSGEKSEPKPAPVVATLTTSYDSYDRQCGPCQAYQFIAFLNYNCCCSCPPCTTTVVKKTKAPPKKKVVKPVHKPKKKESAPPPPVVVATAPQPQPVPKSADKCVELSFGADVGGKVRWGIASSSGPMPPSSCNAQKQDDGPWTAWAGQCDDCVGAIGYIRGILGRAAEIFHKYLYGVTARQQTLRFSTAVWSDVVYICLERKDGKRSCGVYMRPNDWKGRYSVSIPDNSWIGDENCPE